MSDCNGWALNRWACSSQTMRNLDNTAKIGLQPLGIEQVGMQSSLNAKPGHARPSSSHGSLARQEVSAIVTLRASPGAEPEAAAEGAATATFLIFSSCFARDWAWLALDAFAPNLVQQQVIGQNCFKLIKAQGLAGI